MVNDSDLLAQADDESKEEKQTTEPLQPPEDIEVKRARLNQIAEQAQKEKKIKPQQLSEEALIINMLMRIPIISNILVQLQTLGTSIYSLATMRSTKKPMPLPPIIQTTPVLPGVYKNLGLINSISDFLTVPMVFLASKLLNKPSPVTLTNFGEWIYSGITLGLTIASLVSPFAAPIIGGVLAVMGLAYSFYLLEKFSKEKTVLQKTIPVLEQQIQSLHELLKEQKKEMADLQAKLQHASAEELEQYDLQITQCSEKIENTYLALSDKMGLKEEAEQQLKTYNDAGLLDNTVGIAVASTFVIAAIVSIFFPPVGFTMLTTAALIGASYAVGRLSISGISSLREHFNPSKDEEAPLPDQEITSTSKIMSRLHHTCSPSNHNQPDLDDSLDEEQHISASSMPHDNDQLALTVDEDQLDIEETQGPKA